MTQPRCSMARFVAFGVFLALTGCAPTIGPSSSDAPGRQSAFFDAFPGLLFEAVGEGCQGEADTLTQISETELLCESLPSPQAAAALILQFDGDIEQLPTFVTTLVAEPRGEGFAVTTEYYYRVPQKNGETAVIRFSEPRIEQTIRRVFASAGGQSF